MQDSHFVPRNQLTDLLFLFFFFFKPKFWTAIKNINHNIKIVGLRYFNVYGKNEYFKNTTASMVLQFGHQLLEGKNPQTEFESILELLFSTLGIKDEEEGQKWWESDDQS